MLSLSGLLSGLLRFYELILFAYVLLSWFPAGGSVNEIRHVLATLCEPYLGIFRRVIPPIGMIDISPIVGFLVLSFVGGALVSALRAAGL